MIVENNTISFCQKHTEGESMHVSGGSDSFANFGWMVPTVITNFGGMWKKILVSQEKFTDLRVGLHDYFCLG